MFNVDSIAVLNHFVTFLRNRCVSVEFLNCVKRILLACLSQIIRGFLYNDVDLNQ